MRRFASSTFILLLCVLAQLTAAQDPSMPVNPSSQTNNEVSLDDKATAPKKERLAPHLGHNVSATSYVLGQWSCTIGAQVAGCGLTDRWTLATVPWLYVNYNMISIVNRYRLVNLPEGGNWTIQAAYFKTFPQARSDKYITYPYEMEAYWLQFIRMVPMARHFRMYYNIATNYYANDKRPFSLRRPIEGRSPFQINLTVLNEVALINRWYLMGELGGLDVFQRWPHVHAGVSFGRSGYTYEWHLGFSLTSTPLSLFNPRSRRDYQQELRDTANGFERHLDRDKTKRDYAIHPEFALQYFF